MSEEGNQAAWRGLADAYRNIAGLQEFDSKTHMFLVAPGRTTTFPGFDVSSNTIFANVPPFTSTVNRKDLAASINQAVLHLADTLPDTGSPFWAPTANSYYSNYGTFLDLVDPGAPTNPAAKQQYLRDVGDYKTAKSEYITAKSNANIAWATLEDKEKAKYNNNQASWETTVYAGQADLEAKYDTYLTEESMIDQEIRKAFGPYAQTQIRYQQAWQSAQPQLGSNTVASVLGATMLTADNGWVPQYSIDTLNWVMTWNTWRSNLQDVASDPTKPWTPAKSVDVSMTTSASDFWSDFGYTATQANGEVLVPEPFFFFGEGSYSTSTEKEDMYKENAAAITNITLNTCVVPVTIPIKAGNWLSGDPGTVFPKLVDSADPNARQTLLYPYVTEAVVVYGTSYTFKFEKKTYDEVKSLLTMTTDGQAVISIFGMAFTEGTYHDKSTRSFSSIQYSDTELTITTQPDLTGNPQLLGVVAIKGPSTAPSMDPFASLDQSLDQSSVLFLHQQDIEKANVTLFTNETLDPSAVIKRPGPHIGYNFEGSMARLNLYKIDVDAIHGVTLGSKPAQLRLGVGPVIITLHYLSGETDMPASPSGFVHSFDMLINGTRDKTLVFNPDTQMATFFQLMPETASVTVSVQVHGMLYWQRPLRLVALITQPMEPN